VNLFSNRFIAFAFAAFAALAASTAVGAQDYPTKVVRVILPWPSGGPTDLIGRLMVNKLSESMGRSFVVDNRSGASGVIGSEAVAKSPPDGYTLLLNSGSTHVVYPGLFKSLPFDPAQDFAPIGIIGSTPVVIVARASLPVKDMKELIAYARANPKTLNLAIPGAGTLPHLVSELVNTTARITMTMIPYKGTPPALTDVMSGNLDLTYVSIASALPLIAAGKLRPLGVTSAKRLAVLGAVPTLTESGLEGLEVSTWYGLWAPKGTPVRILERLNAEIAKAAKDETLKARYAEISTDLEPMSREQFSKFFGAESKRWLKVLETAQVRPE
jgi:tripartite-type tricarboxylate transporter receptor subunit TctC